MTVKICTPNTGSTTLAAEYQNGSFELYIAGQPGKRAYAAVDSNLSLRAPFENALSAIGRPTQNLWVDDPTKYDVIFRTRLGVPITLTSSNLADNLYLFADNAALSAALTALGITASDIQGTANQILVDASTLGLFKLSAPQRLDTLADFVANSILATVSNKPRTLHVLGGTASGVPAATVADPSARYGFPYMSFAFTQGTLQTGTRLADVQIVEGFPTGTLNIAGFALITHSTTGAFVAIGGLAYTDSTHFAINLTAANAALLVSGTPYTVRVILFPTPVA